MENTKLRDALNNVGLPQLVWKSDLNKQDIKIIIATIKDFDNYYLQGWKTSQTRQFLVNFVNENIIVYRWYSLEIMK